MGSRTGQVILDSWPGSRGLLCGTGQMDSQMVVVAEAYPGQRQPTRRQELLQINEQPVRPQGSAQWISK